MAAITCVIALSMTGPMANTVIAVMSRAPISICQMRGNRGVASTIINAASAIVITLGIWVTKMKVQAFVQYASMNAARTRFSVNIVEIKKSNAHRFTKERGRLWDERLQKQMSPRVAMTRITNLYTGVM